MKQFRSVFDLSNLGSSYRFLKLLMSIKSLNTDLFIYFWNQTNIYNFIEIQICLEPKERPFGNIFTISKDFQSQIL